MSAESPRHVRAGALTVAPRPPSDRTLIDAVSGFISDVRTGAPHDARDAVLWARFHTADVNEPTGEEREADVSPLLLSLGYGSGVQLWLVPPTGEAQEVMSWRQGTVRVLHILPTPCSGDSFAAKRPLMALCDSAGPGPQYCSISFLSVRGGEQVKSIKFKNPILDVLANKRSVVVSFCERFAVFDAGTLEDRLSVTTCFPCPCPLGGSAAVNPLALGDRWLAYADKKLSPAKRSSGGCEGEGVSSYTATVLHAAKSLSKGLRGLGESVASGLAGARALSQSPSPPNTEQHHPGVVSILDIEGPSEEDNTDGETYDPLVAHFVAHSDAIISLKFDASGMLLVTADKRGHDFHVFRIHPHPCGPSLASVHHLYILHRGDTTAKVQDIAISLDSRWTAVSTLRGTTHVFPISPYGGPCGVRTHTQPRVVNRLSRFQRSAGLPIQAATARSSSPVGDGMSQGGWFPNPRLPPYPLPSVAHPLAQLRPTTTAAGIPTHTITRNSAGRQRLSSQSEDAGGVPLLACARWGSAPPLPPAPTGTAPLPRSPAAQALYLMTATGHLLQYILHPRSSSAVAKEKVSDETPVELGVELVAQWPLSRSGAAPDTHTHLPNNCPLLVRPPNKGSGDAGVSDEERWLAQVEMVTHAGPHRRLWMGPQFVFKTYNSTLCGSSSSLLEAEAVEVEVCGAGTARSPPVNISGSRPLVPVLIDSGSTSSLEHSPSDGFRRKSYIMDAACKPIGDRSLGDVQLKEDLAEAMRETEHGSGRREAQRAHRGTAVARAVDPLGTVVVPDAECAPPECDDPDEYTCANTDETLFRPVVSAPTCLPQNPDLSTSPLPAGTRIPVENLTQTDPITPDDDSAPLKSEVVIPAALTSLETTTTVAGNIFTCTENEDKIVSCEDPSEKIFESVCGMVDETKSDNLDEIIDESNIDYEKCKITLCNEPDMEKPKHDISEIKTVGAEPINAKRKSKKNYSKYSSDIKPDYNEKQNILNEEDNNVENKHMPNIEKEILKNTMQDRKVPCESAHSVEAETVTIKRGLVDESNKSDTTKTTKNSGKGKSRDRRSVTPRDDPRYENNMNSDSKLQSIIKIEQTSYTEADVCEPQSSVRKSNKKSAKYIDNNKQSMESKQECDAEPECVQFNLKLPSNKKASSVIEQSLQEELYVKKEDYKSVDESDNLDLKPVNSEDQIWAMLTDNPNVNISSKAEEPRKLHEDKPKIKKSKKNKKVEVDFKEVICKEKSEEEIVTITDCSNFESLNNEKENFSTHDKYETITDVCKKESFEIYPQKKDEKTSITCEISAEFNINEGKFNEPTSNEEDSQILNSNEVRKDSFESLDVPIDFDVYLMNKEKDKANTITERKSDKSEVLQELFGNTVFTVQPTKSRKHRKERMRNEDFVTVEKSADTQNNGPAIINIDMETHPMRQSVIKKESDTILGSLIEDFPTIGSSHRSHKKRCITPSSNLPPIVKSYSSVTSVSKPKYEDMFGMELGDILDPPMPCRTAIHEKLAEICKRTDIAVAECDSPDDYDSSGDLELPPMEFCLDEFKINVMRDSLIETGDRFVDQSIDTDVDRFRDYGVDEERIPEIAMQECDSEAPEDIANFSKTKTDNMDKGWEDDNASPVTSQTDSDKDDKKIASVDPAQNTQRNINKKKSRHKRKK